MRTRSDVLEFAAGNLTLDFLNTRRLANGRGVDLLRTSPDLEAWLSTSSAGVEAGGLVEATPYARILLSEARDLRDAIEALVIEWSAKRELSPPGLHALNRALAQSRKTTHIHVIEGRVRLVAAEVGASLLAPLVPVALAAAKLLADEAPGRIRRCASKGCRLWFLDTSKNGRRRWCSMARCGNRAKAAAHHRKRRSIG